MRVDKKYRIAAFVGPAGVVLLTFIPLFFWVAIIPLADRSATLSGGILNVGRIAGIIGMVLFALTLILSARFACLEKWFGGLDHMYRTHHRMGAVSFLFLLVHPLAVVTSYIPTSLKYATSFLIPSDDWALNFGLLALTGMIVLIVLAVFADSFTFLPYQVLKRGHSFFGIFFFFAFLHTILISSDVSRNFYLKGYFIVLTSAAIASYAYRTIGGKVLVKRYAYQVCEVRNPADRITEIRMIPYGKSFTYKPGQFVFVYFEGKSVSKEIHPFSLSSTPYERELAITIKALGDYTTRIRDISPGTVAKIEGPYGQFSFLNTSITRQIWIAGGIGITPFLSMARTLPYLEEGVYKVDLYYCAKTEEELVYVKELEHIMKLYPSFRVFSFCSTTSGYLTINDIVRQSEGIADKEVFLCGPHAMMRNLRKQLIFVGVPKHLIHSEVFQLL